MLMKIAVCLSLGLMVSGCAWLGPSEVSVDSKGQGSVANVSEDIVQVLLPVDVLRDDFLMRQRVTVRWADRKESFDAVLQKQGKTLLLMGLGPMNTVGFSLTLDEHGVAFDNRSGRELPFQPERILADVQRVFYPWIEEGDPCLKCERHGIRAGLEIRERIGARFLEERSFKLVGRPDRGEIIVRYEAWTKGPFAPSRAVLHNGWFDYELVIDTMSIEQFD